MKHKSVLIVLVVIITAGTVLMVRLYSQISPGLVEGTISEGPISATCRAEDLCTRPLADKLVELYNNKGAKISETKTDKSGRYSFQLASGSYRLKFPDTTDTKTYEVKVLPGEATVQNLAIDTGIK